VGVWWVEVSQDEVVGEDGSHLLDEGFLALPVLGGVDGRMLLLWVFGVLVVLLAGNNPQG